MIPKYRFTYKVEVGDYICVSLYIAYDVVNVAKVYIIPAWCTILDGLH